MLWSPMGWYLRHLHFPFRRPNARSITTLVELWSEQIYFFVYGINVYYLCRMWWEMCWVSKQVVVTSHYILWPYNGQFRKTLATCTDPGQPVYTSRNIVSDVHTAWSWILACPFLLVTVSMAYGCWDGNICTINGSNDVREASSGLKALCQFCTVVLFWPFYVLLPQFTQDLANVWKNIMQRSFGHIKAVCNTPEALLVSQQPNGAQQFGVSKVKVNNKGPTFSQRACVEQYVQQ